MRTLWGTATDRGQLRSLNEDSLLAYPPIFLVADGMGGHAAGDVASKLVVEEFSSLIGRESTSSDDIHECFGRTAQRIRETLTGKTAGTTVAGVAITEHEGRVIQSRSQDSILREIEAMRDKVPGFTGVVSEFGRGDTGHHRTRYQLLVEPPLWRLGLMHNSRMFQTQTTDIILRTLLNERGVTNVVFDLKRPPEEREYCVQYRETDFDFISRVICATCSGSIPERSTR